MDRLKKFIWMILIFWIVFFIVCDEKWYQIWLENNHIIFNKTWKKSESLMMEKSLKNGEWIKRNIVKNSKLIQINEEFENPITLRKSNEIDTKYLAKIEKKKLEKEKIKNQEKVYTWPSIVDLNTKDTISSVFQWNETQNTAEITEIEEEETQPVLYKNSHRIKIYSWFENPITMRKSVGLAQENPTESSIDYNEKYELNNHIIDDTEEKMVVENKEIENIDNDTDIQNSRNIDEDESKSSLVKIEKYQLNKHPLVLRKWVIIKHNFIVENEQNTEIWISDSMLQNLLENEAIDFNTLESENDEFLQKIFEKTKDIEVMNLIVETYLNEYQFAKAKRFIDNLPEMYLNELKPSLNLRVAFNSFPLGSPTVYGNLESLIQNYGLKNEISDEDKNRYLWVLALMNQNYDKFFEIAKNFGSEKNKTFVLKLQWYKDQIAKQMWMPDYYFDTLVSLELFNQWLFQPAKVLALYSLQQNSNYILPYQILAYANFLTNSRDTSIEYFKKLVDLDPNNAEKYRFLMWIAFYRNEKYEQSVVMLSMIKDEKLRLDAQRYLINNYLKLNQKNKLIVSWNKLLWSENLVASDFYTYFYETFFHPYSEWKEFELYAYDTELANKMLRVCSITLQDDEKVVCTYGTIGRNIALWQFDWIEQYLLNLVAEYPQWYLYQALWDYYIQQKNPEKAKAYLLKAVSLTQKTSQRSQIKKLLWDIM